MRRRIILILLVLIFTGLRINAQISPEDRIKGTWLTEKKDGKVEIFRTGNTYSGKLIWALQYWTKTGNQDMMLIIPTQS